MNTDDTSRMIDLKQLFLYIYDHIAIIIVVGIVFALLICGYKYSSSGEPLDQKKVFGEILEKNKAANNPKAGEYNYSTERQVVEGSCIVKAQVVIEYNLDILNKSDNPDYNSVMLRYQNDVVNRMFSSDTLIAITRQINSNTYEGVDELKTDDLRYMLNWTFGAANTSSYSVTDINTQRAMDIANLVSAYFQQNVPQLENIESVSVIETPAMYYDTTGMTQEFTAVDIIKYVVLGGFVGVFLMCAVYLCIFVAKYTVRTVEDLSSIGLDCAARIPAKGEKVDVECRRLAYNLSISDGLNKVLFIPIDGKTDASELISEISNVLIEIKSDIMIEEVANIMDSPDATLEALESDAVILFATFGKTLMSDISYAKSEIEKTKKKILGVVINKCKH